MIKKTFFALLCLFLVVGVVFAGTDKKDKGINKGATISTTAWFDINNLLFAVTNNGSFSKDILNDKAGFYYPKGTGSLHTAIYQDGLVWGGKVHEDHDSIRVGGSAYIQGLQEGKVINGKPDDPTKPKYRTYKIRKDWLTATDISSSDRVQFQKDYDEWPVSDGAPVGTDGKPLFIGDEVLWYVANDYNPSNTLLMYGSPPIGIEQQVTVWGYNQPGALANLAFKRYIIINTGSKRVDSMFVSQWSDPDDGDGSDDVVGCDSVLSIGYVYNGRAQDAFYGSNPPSAGFDFFQGPRVKSPGDSGIWKGKRIKDWKNLGMTSFTLFDRTLAAYGDPPQGTYTGTIQWWHLLHGLQGPTGNPFVDPKTGIPNVYVANGDPVKRTGWVDGTAPVPGDRRMCMNSGPFTFAPGDTQEIVVAYIAAQGTDRISSVALLKFYDQQAQLAYDNFFNVPGPPPPPTVSVAELDGKIILSWGDPVAAKATESYNNGGYAFQGYNVYQMPAATVKSKDEAKLLQVYDIANDGITTIIDKAFDPVSGLVLDKPMQFGNDISDVQHSYTITQDWINGVPLANNQRYYFAVTAYAFNPSPTAVPNNLENSLVALKGSDGSQGCVPQGTKPGYRWVATAGDTLRVTHTAGVSEGIVVPTVVNPAALNGKAYELSFDASGNWILKEAGTQVYTSSNISGTGFYPIISGVNVFVSGPPPGFKSYDLLGTTRWWTWAGASPSWSLEGFNGAIGWGGNWLSIFGAGGTTLAASDVHNVLIEFAATDLTGALTDPNDAKSSSAYRYLRSATAAAAKPEFAPFIINKTSGYAYQDRRPICMKVTDLETNKQLDVGFLENNTAVGTVDGKWFPPDYNVTSNRASSTSPREWAFIFNTEYGTANKAALTVDILNTKVPLMWWIAVDRRGNVAPVALAKFQINANHPFTAADKYAFTSAAPSYDAGVAVADVAKINVFPNPYFGFNLKETSKAQRFVTFSHLPPTAKIRVFTLAGTLVKTILKSDPTQYAQWDLRNENGLPVASGMYIVHIDMSDLGLGNKILKVAIIQEAQFLDQVANFPN